MTSPVVAAPALHEEDYLEIQVQRRLGSRVREDGGAVTVTEDRARERLDALRERAAKRAVERRNRWGRRSLIAPAVIYTILVTQIPFVITIWYSLQSYNLLRPAPPKFVGLDS